MEILNAAVFNSLQNGQSFEQSWDSLKQLREELKPASGEQQELEQMMVSIKERFPLGTIVDINHTGYTGEVIKYRTTLGGFYPAVRYPLDVKIIKKDPKCKHDVIGNIYEYSVDQLLRIDMLEKAYEDVLNDREPRDLNDVEYIKCYTYWAN